MQSSNVVLPFVLVTGVGRSGTSLLKSMLASHSQIAFPPELSFIRRYIATGRLNRAYRRGGVPAVRSILETDSYLRRLDLGVGELLSPFCVDGESFSDIALYKTILGAYGAKSGKPYVGDKDPRSIEYLRLISHYWP